MTLTGLRTMMMRTVLSPIFQRFVSCDGSQSRSQGFSLNFKVRGPGNEVEWSEL